MSGWNGSNNKTKLNNDQNRSFITLPFLHGNFLSCMQFGKLAENFIGLFMAVALLLFLHGFFIWQARLVIANHKLPIIALAFLNCTHALIATPISVLVCRWVPRIFRSINSQKSLGPIWISFLLVAVTSGYLGWHLFYNILTLEALTGFNLGILGFLLVPANLYVWNIIKSLTFFM
jgi:hypothetical protein